MNQIKGTGNLSCPFVKDANRMCNILVNEVYRASTWADMIDATDAIVKVRSREKSHVAEWEHLNNPSPGGNCMEEKA